MALNFRAYPDDRPTGSDYALQYSQGIQNIGNTVAEGLQQRRAAERQALLDKFLRSKEERDQAQFNMEQSKFSSDYGSPLDPNATIQPQASLFTNTPQGRQTQTVPVGQSTNLIQAFNEWRAKGMPKAGARGEFIPALAKDERNQFYGQGDQAWERDFKERMFNARFPQGGVAGNQANSVGMPSIDTKTAIPGYESTGAVDIDGTETKGLRTSVAELETFRAGLSEYRDLIKRYGTSEHTNRAVQGQMEAYAKNLQLKIKNLAQLGVLSASDIPFIEQQIPGPGIFKSVNGMLGALDTAERLMNEAVSQKMRVSGYSPTGGGSSGLMWQGRPLKDTPANRAWLQQQQQGGGQ